MDQTELINIIKKRGNLSALVLMITLSHFWNLKKKLLPTWFSSWWNFSWNIVAHLIFGNSDKQFNFRSWRS
jgi:hypothetical protein